MNHDDSLNKAVLQAVAETQSDNTLSTILDGVANEYSGGMYAEYAKPLTVTAATKAIIQWRDDAVQTAQLDLLTRLEDVGKGKIIVDDRDGWMQFAQQLVEAIQSERALIEKRMM